MEDFGKIKRAIGKDHDACGLGIVAKLHSPPSHMVVRRALAGLTSLSHRGAIDGDGISGDGAGILIEIPHEFFQQFFPLPRRGEYGVATLFTPQGSYGRYQVLEAVEQSAVKLNYKVWLREVPVGSKILGPTAKACEPSIFQIVFISSQKGHLQQGALHRLRILLQKAIEKVCKVSSLSGVSTSTLTYKAMVQPRHLADYFPDLDHPKMRSRFATVHTRFSTNTLPNWQLIQPFDRICHNGEFNTLKGNLSWLMADIAEMRRTGKYPFCFDDIFTQGLSDSCLFDRALDLKVMGGELVVDALRQMLPPAWHSSSRYNRLFRRYLEHLNLNAEPWGALPRSIYRWCARWGNIGSKWS